VAITAITSGVTVCMTETVDGKHLGFASV
jgi:hypothetical protein